MNRPQHLTLVELVVVGIFGFVHQVAVRSDGPPRTDDTICQGGTFSFDGLEISFTPVDKVDWTTAVLVDLVPRLLIRSCTSAGPPLLAICRLFGSVTTLAFCTAFRTSIRSCLFNFSAKKCWLTRTLLSSMQPRVLPS